MGDPEMTSRWTHTMSSPVTFLLLTCPCGIAHTVDAPQSGGMSIVDCCCGRTFKIDH